MQNKDNIISFTPSEKNYLSELEQEYKDKQKELDEILSLLHKDEEEKKELRESILKEKKDNLENAIQEINNDRNTRIIESFYLDKTEELAEDLEKQLEEFFSHLSDEKKDIINTSDNILPPLSANENLCKEPKDLFYHYVTVNRVFLIYLKDHNYKRFKDFVVFLRKIWEDQFGYQDFYPTTINQNNLLFVSSLKKSTREVNAQFPNSLVIPTIKPYQHGLSLFPNDGAFLQPLKSVDGLKFKNGRIYFENMQQISEIELQNMKTKENIQKIDLVSLRIFYSIIFTTFAKNNYKHVTDIITMYVPDLAEYFGLQRNLNKSELANMLNKAECFHDIVGILYESKNERVLRSILPVLNFEGYREENNTISFSSPYLNHLIELIYGLAKEKEKPKKVKFEKKEKPLYLPSHSYLVDSDIAKEQNKVAVENVLNIVAVIEQAGNNVPHIGAKTLIEHNVQLLERLETSTNPTQLLQRTFKKTWELLRSKTHLQEKYKDIELPDPDDPAYIPTMKNVNKLIFSFSHKGKNNNENS